jgi:hypothetical protein
MNSKSINGSIEQFLRDCTQQELQQVIHTANALLSHVDDLVLEPPFEELLVTQRAVKKVFDLSNYEAASIAVQHIQTRTLCEALQEIAVNIQSLPENSLAEN